MTTLRWILGITATALGLGFIALSIVGGGFRKSFGASDTHPFLVLLPPLALGLLVASLVAPAQKPLLHLAALVAVGMAAFCLWQIVTMSATVLWFALLYLGFWFAYYAHAAWGVGARP